MQYVMISLLTKYDNSLWIKHTSHNFTYIFEIRLVFYDFNLVNPSFYRGIIISTSPKAGVSILMHSWH